MTILSKNLKRFRQAKQLTQEGAAEVLGVSAQTISRWECGITLPDASILPQIARLYCITIDDLFKETSVAYDNYACRLGSVYEATKKPEDFLRADQEYQKLLHSGNYSAEDLRMYGILHQYMMQYCITKAAELFEKGLAKARNEDRELYWSIQRQKNLFLCEIGKDQAIIDEFLPRVEGGSSDLHEWICLIQIYYFRQNYETALFWAEKAEKLFPESAMLHIYLGDIFRGIKCYKEAFSHWQRARQLEPEWMDSAYSMAACYEELDDWENACAAWQAIADDLSARGYDVEANWPHSKALQCREKLGRPM